MEIKKEINGKTFTVSVSGRLDTSTAPELEKQLGDLAGIDDLILDFNNLEYISSAGLRVILKAQKITNKQGSMKLVNVNDCVMEIFDITGFSDILNIE